VQDQPSTSDKDKEPPRPRTIPDDFLWDPEAQAWYPPGTPSEFDLEAWRRNFEQTLEEIRKLPPIPPEKLRVPPGTLDVPPAWRMSLGGEERDLFSELPEDDENSEQEQPTMSRAISPGPDAGTL
jgi:hypothetical protein